MIPLLSITIHDKSDALNAYTTYFRDGSWPGFGGAVGEAAIIAIAAVLLGVIIFYYVIGRSSYKASTLAGWFITMIIVGAVTFFGIEANTGIHTKNYGFPPVIEKAHKEAVKNLEPDSDAYIKYTDSKATLKKNCKKGIFYVKPLFDLCLYTSLASLLAFFLISLLAQHGPTKYARNIPFKLSK